MQRYPDELPTTTLGQDAEKRAESFLKGKGLLFVDKNVRFPFGEIDLIMKDGDTLVFTEVRFRKTAQFGLAVETVSRQKQKKLYRAANAYLQKNRQLGDMPCRFDVVALTGVACEWIQNAFTGDGLF